MGYLAQTFIAGEQPTTAKWNILWSNDASFNDGTGIGNATIGPSKLATGAAGALVTTSEGTASGTYVQLATTTDNVSVTIGANGLAWVAIFCNFLNSLNQSYVGYAVSGATTVAATDTAALLSDTTVTHQVGATFLATGLTAGSNTFGLRYRVTGGTGTFLNRRIAVMPV